MCATMPAIGWTPEGTATHQQAQERLADWMHTAPRRCPWCWGQEVLWQRSDAFGAFIPVTCPHCGPR